MLLGGGVLCIEKDDFSHWLKKNQKHAFILFKLPHGKSQPQTQVSLFLLQFVTTMIRSEFVILN